MFRPLAAAMRADHLRLFHLGHVESLREFLLAVLAVKNVLGHNQSPARQHSATLVPTQCAL